VFAPDGCIVTVSDDKTALLWDRDGKPFEAQDRAIRLRPHDYYRLRPGQHCRAPIKVRQQRQSG
jgi:hypothetical protein